MDILVCFAECNIMYVALLASLNNPDEREKRKEISTYKNIYANPYFPGYNDKNGI